MYLRAVLGPHFTFHLGGFYSSSRQVAVLNARFKETRVAESAKNQYHPCNEYV